MENKKRKMFAAVAVIMLCAVAIIGVGYAYTATTINKENNAHSEYITLSQSGTGKYNFTGASDVEIKYNVANTGEDDFEFTLSNETGQTVLTDVIADQTVVKIGNDFSVDASSVGRHTANLVCTITTTGFTLKDNWKFYIVVTDALSTKTTLTLTATDTWSGSAQFTIPSVSAVTTSVNVAVYYGYATASVPSTAPLAAPLNNASITFTAEETSPDGKAIVLDVTSASIAEGATVTLKATMMGDLDGTITWTTSSAEIATIDATGATCVVTGADVTETSKATIMASVTDSSGTYTVICVVTVTAA